MVERETVQMLDDDGRVIGVGCKLDQSQCDHDFGDQGEPDEGVCSKCGTSIWAYAFMECP